MDLVALCYWYNCKLVRTVHVWFTACLISIHKSNYLSLNKLFRVIIKMSGDWVYVCLAHKTWEQPDHIFLWYNWGLIWFELSSSLIKAFANEFYLIYFYYLSINRFFWRNFPKVWCNFKEKYVLHKVWKWISYNKLCLSLFHFIRF